MGTDVDVDRGVLVHHSELIAILRLSKAGVETVKQKLLSDEEYCHLLSGLKAWTCNEDGSDYEEAGSALSWLNKVQSRFSFHVWLRKLCEASGCEPGRYEQHEVDDLTELLIRMPVRIAAQEAGLNLPTFGIQVFANTKLTGLWGVELGSIYFDFIEDECFERRLTPVGKSLQDALGSALTVSEWATLSY